jgi:hypothetical protein
VTNTLDAAKTKRIQTALLTVPGAGAFMPSGADGIWGGETDRGLAFVVATAGGVMEQPGPVVTLPEGYLELLATIESGNRPYVQAASSSASGLYQFIRSTWEGEGGKWGPTLRPAFGGLRPSKAEQDQRVTSFTLKNAAALAKAGIPINRASLYACHFLGAGTAVDALLPGVAVTTRMDALVDAGAVKANPSILKDKTLADFLTWLHRKTGDWAR